MYNYIQVTVKLKERVLGTALFDPESEASGPFESRAEVLAKPYLPIEDKLEKHEFKVENIQSTVIRLTETFVPEIEGL